MRHTWINHVEKVVGWRRRLDVNALACNWVHEKRGDRGLVGQFLSGGTADWRWSKTNDQGGGGFLLAEAYEKAEQHKKSRMHACVHLPIGHPMRMQRCKMHGQLIHLPMAIGLLALE